MALFVDSAVRKRAQVEVSKARFVKKAAQLLTEASASYSTARTYDIFLSHSIRDAELILGMKATLEDLGYSVYVDWIEDPQMDRSKVTPATADKLRQRMDSSASLFYVTTENTDNSKWMPWECGYFDGKKEKVAIAPIKGYSTDNSYSGQEYLGLYPYVVQQADNLNKQRLWIRKSNRQYIDYDSWVKTPNARIVWKEG